MTTPNPVAPASPPELGTRAFIVAVLWMHGRAIAEIARVVDWTPGQVKGFVHRHFEKARSHMTTEERLVALEELKADRKDGNRLKDQHFKPIAILDAPAPPQTPTAILKRSWVKGLMDAEGIEDIERRESSVAECHAEHRVQLGKIPPKQGGADLSTKAGRRDARLFEQEVLRMVKAEQKKRAERENGLAEKRGTNASALDYLDKTRLLRDSAVTTDKKQSSEETRRLEAGMRLRKYIEGTRLGGLGAIDYERATMGSSSGPKQTMSAYKLQCIHTLGGIRTLMSSMDYVMIEAVVDQDIFVWERSPANSKGRARIYDGIRQLLDAVAVHENLMTREEYQVRWDEVLPLIEHRSRGEVQQQVEAVSEFMEATR